MIPDHSSFLFLGLLAGGPAAIWSSYIVTIFFMIITAAVLAEICSGLPLVMTPDRFQSSRFRLGKYAKPFYVCAAVFNALVFAVDISPFYFPVTAQTFNFAVVIFGAISVFALLSWYFTPEDKWLRREQILRAMEVTD